MVSPFVAVCRLMTNDLLSPFVATPLRVATWRHIGDTLELFSLANEIEYSIYLQDHPSGRIVFVLLALLYGSTLIALPSPLGLTLPARNNPSTPLYSCQKTWVLPGQSESRIRESPVNEHVLFFDRVGIVETASLAGVVVLLAGFGNCLKTYKEN